MDIDFTKQIKELKEKDVLHKPFPTGTGYALYDKNKEGNFVKVLFSSEKQIKKYLNDLGYDWGDEGKNEYTSFDCQHRLLKVLPELSEVDTVAADPQWDPDKAPEETVTKHNSTRTMEDLPHLAVELREVDHPIGYDDRTHASDDKTSTSKKKLPPWMDKDKKKDKKDGKKGDKKGDKKNGKNGKKGDKKNGEKEDEGKDNLPPWLKKKKSKSNYSKLWKKVNSNIRRPGQMFGIGDMVENINPDCKHFGSQGSVVSMRKISGKHTKNMTSAHDHGKHAEEEQDAGYLFAYSTINVGTNWDEGDVLEKTGDQLHLIEGQHTGYPVK